LDTGTNTIGDWKTNAFALGIEIEGPGSGGIRESGTGPRNAARLFGAHELGELPLTSTSGGGSYVTAGQIRLGGTLRVSTAEMTVVVIRLVPQTCVILVNGELIVTVDKTLVGLELLAFGQLICELLPLGCTGSSLFLVLFLLSPDLATNFTTS